MRKELLKTRAYAIFSEELHKHLAYAKKELSGQNLSSQFIQTARIIFHTIKGGAGFFGFNEIEANAAKLENIFENAKDTLPLSEIDTAIKNLERALESLPKPEVSLEDKNA